MVGASRSAIALSVRSNPDLRTEKPPSLVRAYADQGLGSKTFS